MATQAKRPQQKSPADRQVEAITDVERIAEALYETQREVTDGGWLPWRAMDPKVHEAYRATVRDLLQRDVIRVGNRPIVERPMEGQMAIEEFETGAVIRFD